MSHSPEQNRKKAEAMKMAEHHAKHAAVDEMKAKEESGMSDEFIIRGMSSDNPRRAEEMKKHGLKDDPNYPGVYGTSKKHRNYPDFKKD